MSGNIMKSVKSQTFSAMVNRNVKLFFKDKAMFFTSLITPLILLVLYGTFLWNVYEDSFLSGVRQGGITVAFCANMLMVQDKVNGADKDFKMTGIKSGMLAMSYYTATLISTLIITFAALGAGLVFIACKGWYLSAADVLLIILDTIILTSFGTALSSLVGVFLTSQGQISAVGTIVSSAYGFICGAYMPISQFPAWLQKVILFLPGTYGTSLLRNHCMGGAFREMSKTFPATYIENSKKSVDCILYFFDHKVSIGAMYAVLVGAVIAVIAAYCIVVKVKSKQKQ